MSKGFGDLVRTKRLAEGLSQAELGSKVNASQPAISTWEQGTSSPRKSQLQNLERVLGKLTVPQGATDNLTVDRLETNAFAAWLRKARAKRDMSVPELATASGVSAVAIYNIESGKSLNPRSETRKRLATALHTVVPPEVQKESEEEQEIQGLGSLTDFDPHSKDDRPSVAGVYVFYDISDRPVYVGKAQNIAKRVADHAEGAFWFRFPIVSHAAYIEIVDDKLRHQVEQVLIRFLKSNAVINRQSVVRE